MKVISYTKDGKIATGIPIHLQIEIIESYTGRKIKHETVNQRKANRKQ